MPRISVLYVTNRPGGFDVLKHDLRRQTFEDFEVVVVDDLADERGAAVREYLSTFDPTYVDPRDPRPSDVWNLNKAYNDGIRACEGELIVSLQDYLWIDEDGLARFWEVYEDTGGFVTGVGDKYGDPSTAADLEAPITIFEEPYADPPTDPVEHDSRNEPPREVAETDFRHWELDWAAFPRGAAYALGGFDEAMDRVYSGDNVAFAYRASKVGYEFYVDRRNESRGFSHAQWFPYPDDWEDEHFNNHPRLGKYDDGEFVLDYL